MKEETNIVLPEAKVKGTMSVEESIAKRRSVRSFSLKELNLPQISQILWAVQGITDEKKGFRAAPSAGALYPLEIYIVKNDGVFYYNIENHAIKRVKEGDMRKALVRASWNQRFIQEAPVSVIICAARDRTTSRYGRRGDRYVDIEVGHAAENIHLQAVALGLASVPVGAFNDSEVKKVLDLPKDIEPIYIVPVGYAQ